MQDAAAGISVRHGLRPGDLSAVTALHASVYAEEHGLGVAFEAYVAEGLARFALTGNAAGRAPLARRAGGTARGAVALVWVDAATYQLR